MREKRFEPAGRFLPAGEHSLASNQSTDLEATIGALEVLDTSNLQMRWREAFGNVGPARLGADLLCRAIAYRLQELALGGLSRQSQLRIKLLSSRSMSGCSSWGSSSVAPLVKPGTRFVREWQGQIHEVQAIDTGDFVYRDKTYRSLSAIAREITGTHQSGPRFFGLGRIQVRTVGQETTDG